MSIVDDPRFKKNPQGRWAAGALILELNLSPDIEPIYTLQDYDQTINGKWYPSLYRLYMEAEDPTEFEFARKYLGSYDQWMAICKIARFQGYLERWRKEIILQVQARALRAMIDESMSESKNSFAANKFLVEKGWIPKEGGKRGRPSKAEIEKAAKIETSEKDRVLEDYNRLMKEETDGQNPN